MTDLSTIAPVERTIEINHPGNGEPLGIKVSVMSMEDDRMKKIKRRLTDTALQLRAKGKTFKASDIAENQVDILAEAITGWDWTESEYTFGGEVPEFNRKNVKAVLTAYPWMANQIDEEIGETKAFFTN